SSVPRGSRHRSTSSQNSSLSWVLLTTPSSQHSSSDTFCEEPDPTSLPNTGEATPQHSTRSSASARHERDAATNSWTSRHVTALWPVARVADWRATKVSDVGRAGDPVQSVASNGPRRIRRGDERYGFRDFV